MAQSPPRDFERIKSLLWILRGVRSAMITYGASASHLSVFIVLWCAWRPFARSARSLETHCKVFAANRALRPASPRRARDVGNCRPRRRFPHVMRPSTPFPRLQEFRSNFARFHPTAREMRYFTIFHFFKSQRAAKPTTYRHRHFSSAFRGKYYSMRARILEILVRDFFFRKHELAR